MNKVGNRDIIGTGSAIVTGADPLNIAVRLNDTSPPLVVQFVFSFADGEPDNTLQLRPSAQPTPDAPSLLVSLINWKNALGTAVQTPIGEAPGGPVILALFVHALVNAAPATPAFLVNYTFSVGPL